MGNGLTPIVAELVFSDLSDSGIALYEINHTSSICFPAKTIERVGKVIRTFLFDMGNVLVHFSHERMCAQMGALCEKTADEVQEVLFESGLQANFERGRFTEQELHRRFEEAVGTAVDYEDLKLAGSDIFQLNSLMPGILNSLKKQGYRLVLLSNTSVTHFEWVWNQFEVLQKFDDHVASYRVGAIKPEAAIFEAALAKIECDPAECFYTDDIALYVETARSLGLQAEVFTDAETLRSCIKQLGVAL
jgi:HAD superfamily hydrolase (TIGR01509 family)